MKWSVANMKKLFSSRINFNLLKYELKRNKTYLVIYSVILFIVSSLPVLITGRYVADNLHDFDSFLLPANFPPYGIIIVAIILVLLTPFILFSYLTTKKSVDVYHSLPIKREDLFLTLKLSSFLLVLIPFTLNFFLSYTIKYFFGYTVISSDIIKYFVYIILLYAVHNLPLFVIMNTGTISDSLIYTGIFVGLPFLAYSAFNEFLRVYLFGISQLSWENMKFLSPLFALVSFIKDKLNMEMIQTTLYWVLVTFLVTTVIRRLYNNRKSEKSEEPFVNDKFFPVMTVVFIPIFFIILNIMNTGYGRNFGLKDFFKLETFVLPTLIVFVVYVILDLFRYRSSKNLLKSSKHFIVIMLLTLFISTTTIVTGGFGFSYRTPDLKNIEYIEVVPNHMNSLHPIFSVNESIYTEYNALAKLRDPETIETVLLTHKGINDLLKSQKWGINENEMIEASNYGKRLPGEESINWQNFSFTYVLKNGDRIKKSFNLPKEVILDFTSMITKKDYIAVTNPIFNTDVKLESFNLFDNTMGNFHLEEDTEIIRENIMSAYLEDIKSMGNESYIYKESKLKYIIKYSVDVFSFKNETNGVNFNKEKRYLEQNSIPELILTIDDRFVNTVRYLDSLDKSKQLNETSNLQIDTMQNDAMETYYGLIGHSYYGVAADSISTDKSKIDNYTQGSHIGQLRDYRLIIDDTLLIPLSPDFKP